MSSLTAQIDDLIRMADAVGWEVRYGKKHRQIIAPNRARPITLPGTPSGPRSVANPESRLRNAGLFDAYEQHLNAGKNESRAAVVAARAKAARKIDFIDAAEAQRNTNGGAEARKNTNGAAVLAAVAKNGCRIVSMEVTPEQAQAWLDATAASEDFSNRPIRYRKVEDYTELMKTGGWQEYLPDGLICIDPKGVLLNGQKRMWAVIGADRPIGFWVAFDVPREQFAFMDIAQTRTAADTFAIAGLPSGPDIQSAIRLSMLYEMMLREEIDRINWMNWRKVRFANDEAFDFYRRRQEIGLLRDPARQVAAKTGLLVASLIAFQFYVDKAWPTRPRSKDGRDPLEEFLNRLRLGENMTVSHPAMALREWVTRTKRDAMDAKREVHLYLLIRAWNDLCVNKRAAGGRVHHNPSWPMVIPFHPDGEQQAIVNLLKP